MHYIVVKQPTTCRQMTLEDLFSPEPFRPVTRNAKHTDTKVYRREDVPEVFRDHFDAAHLVRVLRDFNAKYASLRARPRRSLYREFHIPKRSGGLRRIDAPNAELMAALRELKKIFETDFADNLYDNNEGALYHTSAFAYVKRRGILDAVKRHQANESRWFAKLDLHDFFGSTTPDFVHRMFSMVFPFSVVMGNEETRKELIDALALAFLDGGLPQGTPISPLITNIMMIPVDFALANTLADYHKQRFIYTRYADDFLISSKYDFSVNKIQGLVKDALGHFGAPFSLNESKTRYGSSSGSNWNLGLMLNKDNQITVGSKRKKEFSAMLTNYSLDRLNGKTWEIGDIQTMQGLYSYYVMVEKERINGIVSRISGKYGLDIMKQIKADIRGDQRIFRFEPEAPLPFPDEPPAEEEPVPDLDWWDLCNSDGN